MHLLYHPIYKNSPKWTSEKTKDCLGTCSNETEWEKKSSGIFPQTVALLLLLLLSPLFPVAAPPGDVVGRSKTLMGGGIQKILLPGVQLMLLFVVVVGCWFVRYYYYAAFRPPPSQERAYCDTTLVPPSPQNPNSRAQSTPWSQSTEKYWGDEFPVLGSLVIWDPGLNSGIEILVLGV